jgi:HNH endonuclease
VPELPDDVRRRIARRDSGCWEWTGARQVRGYGEWRRRLAHRVVYELLVGPIPEGLELDHLCRNPACVNPEHLDPVTHRENLARGTGFVGVNLAKTHCVHGHVFDEANTYRPARGDRQCRRCRADRERARQARLREAR